MLKPVRFILQQFCKFDFHIPLLLGVSGGPDSLVMLDLISGMGYSVVAAHVNHKLRPEADEEAEKVRQAAADRQVPFVTIQRDVTGFAQEQMLSIEEAARYLRYRFLFEQANIYSAQAVLVAHTADDQVETVLMHLLRGAGLAGLKGMEVFLLPNPWSQTIPLARPLLNTWREEILVYCETQGLNPIQDPSNLDTRYYRNRLRHELIPFLEGYNPNVRQVIGRTAQVLGSDNKVLEHYADQAWANCLLDQGSGYVALHTRQVLEEMEGIQRRLIRKGISMLRPGLRDIDFDLVERALQAMQQGPSSSRRDLGAGLHIFIEGETTWLAVWEGELPSMGWPEMPQQEQGCLSLSLQVPGILHLEGGWELQANLVEDGRSFVEKAQDNRDPYQAWLDIERLRLPLSVRCRLPGDRFQPLGMEGHSLKLSDFMINRKLPLRARSTWPLVCSDEEIAWLPGFRLGHPFRIRPETRQAVHLHLYRRSLEEGQE